MEESEIEQLIQMLKLAPHPEGGYYRETFKDAQTREGRALSTCIYFLLPAGQISRLHRVDATEIWHFYTGSPLILEMGLEEKSLQTYMLGPDISSGEQPQIIVPAHHWQTARSTGDWTLVGCTVSPGFEFSGFEMKGA